MARVHRQLLAACLAGAALVGGCSPFGGASGATIPADVATALAARADRVAAELDAGACDQALADARSLEGDLAAVKAGSAVRADALSRAARVVAAINCPPTTTTTAAPAPPDQSAGPGPGHPKERKDGHGPEHDH